MPSTLEQADEASFSLPCAGSVYSSGFPQPAYAADSRLTAMHVSIKKITILWYLYFLSFGSTFFISLSHSFSFISLSFFYPNEFYHIFTAFQRRQRKVLSSNSLSCKQLMPLLTVRAELQGLSHGCIFQPMMRQPPSMKNYSKKIQIFNL